MTAPHSDDDLTEAAFAAGGGDRAALERFVRGTQRDLWRMVAHFAGPGLADDLTQETYLRALPSLPSFAGRSSARTWLMSIARRVVVDHIRAARVRPRADGAADLDWISDRKQFATQSGMAGFEEVVEVGLLLEGLLPERREALLLTQVIGMSYGEAAEVVGVRVGTIRSRVARARDDLLHADRNVALRTG
ncbi:sigma-70 family RNA polymerase sigma factor [Actinophytocola algeriensis]|uniref:RNA polymerase sigma factor n=1 Tax=Actinophytocola algeriensis TaxID=1768010 RepID=A0A7W7Q9L7_9PSEU|nr:sigma-70 family RNA polymerase sigma factor [Actinophytocola algeriensis]MBB4909199.1 RNA polymerase sigma-70 factor (ECF subfamily) [Actinophytocola algeriensis]MBE1474413.1 RNA polymerase sigma-70 factor (ECF subfamily) [Actinophytocola algeriensis]